MTHLRQAPRGAALLLLTSLAWLGAAPAAQPTAARPSDREITRAIELRLDRSPAVAAHRIDVATNKGIVTLTGSADSVPARREAVRLAASVRGVRAILDKLTVRPVARTDERLRRDIKEALADDPATSALGLKVAVSEGVATVRGTVGSLAERALVSEVLAGVKGVRGIDNELTVRPAKDRPDGEIKEAVERRLRRDAMVDSALVEVRVAGGKVSLSGTVGSAAEKVRAVLDSYVPGAVAVDASGLDVDPSRPRKDLRRTELYTKRTDAETADDIRTALMADPRVYSGNVEVEVDRGLVTLTGTVNNLRAKLAAAEAARGVIGAWRVRNLIRVRPKTSPLDEEVARRVVAALARDAWLSDEAIKVSVLNGRVRLAGTVDSVFERDRAGLAASSVIGAVAVRNDLRVAAAVAPGAVRDLALKRQIEAALRFSPLVDARQINVTVAERTAVLSGTVDTWREQEEALRLATEAGALYVTDRLKIRLQPDYLPR